jgi:hemerythrin superfamily protein
MPDVTELIETDHREVEALFAQFKSSKDPKVAEKICDELDAHAAAEEQAVYPRFEEEVPGTEKLVKEGEKEHGEARQLIGRIKNTSDPQHLAELVGELEQAVQHHVKEEETEMLPKARQELDSGRLEALGADFEAAKNGSS